MKCYGFAILLGSVLLLCFGCQPPSQKTWSIAYYTPDGEIMEGMVSTEDLFAGRSALKSNRTIPTKNECLDASFDFQSGCLLSVEKDERASFLRLYDACGDIVTEYVGQKGLRYFEPVLQKGGRRFAFIAGNQICTAQACESPGEFAITKYDQPRVEKGGTILYRIHWHWTSKGFVLQKKEILAQMKPEGEFRVVSKKGLLSGVLVNDDIIAHSRPGISLKIWNTRTGEIIGYANMGYDYSRFLRMSPCGEYVMYEVPPRLFVERTVYLHHLKSGRRAPVRFPQSCRWVIGWCER